MKAKDGFLPKPKRDIYMEMLILIMVEIGVFVVLNEMFLLDKDL